MHYIEQDINQMYANVTKVTVERVYLLLDFMAVILARNSVQLKNNHAISQKGVNVNDVKYKDYTNDICNEFTGKLLCSHLMKLHLLPTITVISKSKCYQKMYKCKAHSFRVRYTRIRTVEPV